MADMNTIASIIEPVVKAMGFDLVRVKMLGGEEEPTLQVMAERPDTRQLTIEDCAEISRALDEPLEAADPIEHAYRLEVSSPGIDRPLTRLQDFVDWSGHLARITLEEKLAGQKKFKGTLDGVDGETILLTDDHGKEHRVPFAMVEDAKLLFTDKLLQETQPLSTEGAEEINEEEGTDNG
ncbi:ribosome maturation protein RimP [Sphingomicrobium astaxanthinifaciens]|uniref:ribosome maturation protein RimP n=1 Tax=Sphingomicrobium astaxanthinifaciens TaxID=1227949 RepID=UPI001FCB41DE|nr:ribosome maturation protein RimP [Sphingomicrobium astaxanthinifaciens]MCJ7420703.1 ribosome maturation protein RimP [Sphingomicrobium astaxanthinifaciens]